MHFWRCKNLQKYLILFSITRNLLFLIAQYRIKYTVVNFLDFVLNNNANWYGYSRKTTQQNREYSAGKIKQKLYNTVHIVLSFSLYNFKYI